MKSSEIRKAGDRSNYWLKGLSPLKQIGTIEYFKQFENFPKKYT